MGNQPDGLLKMEKFDGNETKIIWPAWKLDLDRRITFEFGAIGVNIVDGKLSEEHINIGDDVETHQSLLNALTPKTRAQVQFKSEWIEKYTARIPHAHEVGQDEEKKEKRLRLTFIGAMNVKAAIERLKSSYFLSIEKHGIANGSKVHKDFVKLKDKYSKGTLPAWLNKVQVQHGIKHEELLNAYVEQLTGLRVIKATDDASVVQYASEALRADKGFMLEAAAKDVLALNYSTPELLEEMMHWHPLTMCKPSLPRM